MANNPTDNTLRLDRDKSTGRDGTPRNIDTENIYIEGDNLEALKILRHTYMGKVKMIYIDPPYNTGNDFIYNDDFTITADEYEERYGEIDGRYFQNLASNGRFHTDWLNMIYPRLKVARDFLSPDGVIFISIDDNEIANLRKVCDEIFGEGNFRNIITVRRGAKSLQAQFSTWDKLGEGLEYILMYTKNSDYRFPKQLKQLDEKRPGSWNNHWRGTNRPTMRYELFGITPQSGQWRWSEQRSYKAIAHYKRMLIETGYTDKNEVPQEVIDSWYEKQHSEIDLLRLSNTGKPEHYIAPNNEVLLNSSWIDLLIGSSSEISQLFDEKIFDNPKLTTPITRMLGFVPNDALVMDFFSGSATTAHAVMALNNSDGGRRKFILVQLPEVTGEKSEARKAGYETICDIGEERIRRAGKKIREESPLTTGDLDVGFRVFRVDSSNMKDVYKRPEEYIQSQLEMFIENIKPDRRPEDLLIQVMLELGIELSAKIEEEFVAGKHVFIVEDGHLIACFDERINNLTVTAIAKRQPDYVAFRDSCFENDAVITNFDQIILAYSPKTRWIIL